MTTSSALPASTPFSVRYLQQHGEERDEREQQAQRARRQAATVECSGKRHAMRDEQRGNPGGKRQPVRQARADDDARGPEERLVSTRRWRSVVAAWHSSAALLEQRQRREALGEMTSTSCRAGWSCRARADRSCALAGVGVEAPARELREPRFDVEFRQARPTRAHCGSPVAARKLLEQQLIAARIRFPGDALRRIAGLRGAQAGEVGIAASRRTA